MIAFLTDPWTCTVSNRLYIYNCGLWSCLRKEPYCTIYNLYVCSVTFSIHLDVSSFWNYNIFKQHIFDVMYIYILRIQELSDSLCESWLVGDLTLKRLETTALVDFRPSDRLVESYFGQRGSHCSCLRKKGKVRLWKSSFASSHV